MALVVVVVDVAGSAAVEAMKWAIESDGPVVISRSDALISRSNTGVPRAD